MRHRTRVYPSSALSLSKSATADLDAQARNPYSRWWLRIPGSRFARPGMTKLKDLPVLNESQIVRDLVIQRAGLRVARLRQPIHPARAGRLGLAVDLFDQGPPKPAAA